MGGYPPVLRPGGCLEQQIDMHRAIANTLSELRIEWTSWISLWSFPAHLNDLDFYKGPDEQHEIYALRHGLVPRGCAWHG
jgi:hypothetical protein